jgi:hypothetical protein
MKLLKRSKQDNIARWSKKDVLMSTIDETITTIAITHKQSLVHADKLQKRKKKQVGEKGFF